MAYRHLLMLLCDVAVLSALKSTKELLDAAAVSLTEARAVMDAHNNAGRQLSSSSVQQDIEKQQFLHGGVIHEFADGKTCLGTDQSRPVMSSSEQDGATARAGGAIFLRPRPIWRPTGLSPQMPQLAAPSTQVRCSSSGAMKKSCARTHRSWWITAPGKAWSTNALLLLPRHRHPPRPRC
jgi:hypothetical protein